MSALLIDLDDTLYDERIYVESGFAAVAIELAKRCGETAEAIKSLLLQELDRSGRGKVFDVVLGRLGLAAGQSVISELVSIYRSHRPALKLYRGVDTTLARLRKQHALAIVTDGLGTMQQAKIEALGLETMVDAIVYCWDENAPKPSPDGFSCALKRLDASADDAIIIGDAPHADMAAAAALGVPSIRIRAGRFANTPNLPGALPVFEIAAFTDIETALRRLETKEIA